MAATTENPLQLAMAAFAERFGGAPSVVASAPGRVELLGNHTDYNGGLVIAAAIDRRTVFVGRRTSGREAKVASVQFDDLDTFSLENIEPLRGGRVDALRPRRVLGTRRVAWAAELWLRSGGRGRCSPRGRAFPARRAFRLRVRCF